MSTTPAAYPKGIPMHFLPGGWQCVHDDGARDWRQVILNDGNIRLRLNDSDVDGLRKY